MTKNKNEQRRSRTRCAMIAKQASVRDLRRFNVLANQLPVDDRHQAIRKIESLLRDILALANEGARRPRLPTPVKADAPDTTDARNVVLTVNWIHQPNGPELKRLAKDPQRLAEHETSAEAVAPFVGQYVVRVARPPRTWTLQDLNTVLLVALELLKRGPRDVYYSHPTRRAMERDEVNVFFDRPLSVRTRHDDRSWRIELRGVHGYAATFVVPTLSAAVVCAWMSAQSFPVYSAATRVRRHRVTDQISYHRVPYGQLAARASQARTRGAR